MAEHRAGKNLDGSAQAGKERKQFKVSPLLGLDAWIDSTLYELRFRLAEFWEDTTIFFRRFHVTGWRRAIFEVLGEAFTWGTVGSVRHADAGHPRLPRDRKELADTRRFRSDLP